MTQRSRLIDRISSIPENRIHPVYDEIYLILKQNLTDDDKPITIVCCPHQSFSMNTNTFLFHNRIPENLWLQFIDYELSGMALRHEAHFLGLSIHTCFRMRHKLYAAVSELAKKRVTGKVQLDAAYSGISHHKVCIVSAIDSQDNMFLNIVGLGVETFEKYKDCKYKFDDPELIVADSKPCIRLFANNLGVEIDQIKTDPRVKRYTTDLGNHLGDLNQLDAEITSLIARTHGCATRYFQQYLDFITYRKKTMYDIDRDKVAKYVFDDIRQTKAYKEEELVYAELPISLKDAYNEYRYETFA